MPISHAYYLPAPSSWSGVWTWPTAFLVHYGTTTLATKTGEMQVPPSSHSLHHDGMPFRGCHEHAAFHGMSCAICKLLSPDEPHEAGKLVNGGPALHEA